MVLPPLRPAAPNGQTQHGLHLPTHLAAGPTTVMMTTMTTMTGANRGQGQGQGQGHGNLDPQTLSTHLTGLMVTTPTRLTRHRRTTTRGQMIPRGRTLRIPTATTAVTTTMKMTAT